MKEPIDKGFSILKKEPTVVYTLPDGSTTIWLNEYVDAMVQAKVNKIVEMLEELDRHGTTHSEFCAARHAYAAQAIALIKGEK